MGAAGISTASLPTPLPGLAVVSASGWTPSISRVDNGNAGLCSGTSPGCQCPSAPSPGLLECWEVQLHGFHWNSAQWQGGNFSYTSLVTWVDGESLKCLETGRDFPVVAWEFSWVSVRAEYLQCPQRNDSGSWQSGGFLWLDEIPVLWGKQWGNWTSHQSLAASECRKGDKAEMLLLLLV